MSTAANHAARIKRATNLRSLLCALREAGDDAYDVDLGHLPVFGGDKPAGCVWSWDHDFVLVGDLADFSDWEIISRTDYDDRRSRRGWIIASRKEKAA